MSKHIRSTSNLVAESPDLQVRDIRYFTPDDLILQFRAERRSGTALFAIGLTFVARETEIWEGVNKARPCMRRPHT